MTPSNGSCSTPLSAKIFLASSIGYGSAKTPTKKNLMKVLHSHKHPQLFLLHKNIRYQTDQQDQLRTKYPSSSVLITYFNTLDYSQQVYSIILFNLKVKKYRLLQSLNCCFVHYIIYFYYCQYIYCIAYSFCPPLYNPYFLTF